MRPTQRGLTEIHLAVVLFGLAGLFGKWVALSPLIIVFGRVFFASLALGLILAVVRRERVLGLGAGHYSLLFLLGVILAFHWTAFFRSIQVSSVAVGLLSYSSFPLFTSFLEPLINRDRWHLRHVLLSLGCLAGVFLIIPRFDLGNAVFQGVLWGLAAGLSFAVLTTLNRRLAQKHPALTVAFFQDLFAALVLLPAVLVLKPALQAQDVLQLVVLGVVCTALSHTLFIQGMKAVSARTASIISSLEPAYGAALALLFLGEVPSPRTVAGGLVIIGSTVIASFAERKA